MHLQRRHVAVLLVAGILSTVVSMFAFPSSSTFRSQLAGPPAVICNLGFNRQNPSFSGDGRYIAFDMQYPGAGLFTRTSVMLFDRAQQQMMEIARWHADGSAHPFISADGRFLAYQDGTPDHNIALYNRETKTTEVVSIGQKGIGGWGGSLPSLSGDGQYVAYQSRTAAGEDGIFVRDRTGAKTILIAAQTESQTPSISADGHSVAYMQRGILVTNITTNRTVLASVGPDGNPVTYSDSSSPSLSADGRYVAFVSSSDKLLPPDPKRLTPPLQSLFVFDTVEKRMVGRVIPGAFKSVEAPSISADGRYVAFVSNDPSLTSGDTNGTADVFVYDVHTNAVTRESVEFNGIQNALDNMKPVLSQDGQFIAYAAMRSAYTGTQREIFVRDRRTGLDAPVRVDRSCQASSSSTAAEEGERTSCKATGDSDAASITGNGRFVLIDSRSTDLLPEPSGGLIHQGYTYVYDVSAGTLSLIQGGTAEAISADGRFAVIAAARLTLRDSSQLYRLDRQTGQMDIASADTAGNRGNYGGYYGLTSDDGRYVAFQSYSTNLVPGDTNGKPDIFLHDFLSGHTLRASVDERGAQQVKFPHGRPWLQRDGQHVRFYSNDGLWSYDIPAGTASIVAHSSYGEGTEFLLSEDGTVIGSKKSLGRGAYRFSSYGKSIEGVEATGTPDARFLLVWGGVDLRLYDARDLSRPSTLVSVDPDGKRLLAWAGAISDDGRYVVFPATVPGSATRDIYLRDVQASKTILLTPHRHTTCAASSSPFKTVFRNPPQPVSFFDHLYQKKRPTSLFEVMKWHTADARNNAADAEPFEVRTSLSAAQIQAADASISFASTSFASPRDDVRNLDIHEQYGDPSNPNSYSIELRSFVRTRCDGAQLVRVVCDGDTDVPESRDRHPPLMNWKADMDTVIGALRQMKFTNERMHGGSNTSSNLIVSTVGRIRREYPALLADAALAALPPSQTIIVVLDAGRESRDEGLKQNYAILSADKAALIGNGTLSTSNRAQ